MNPKHTKYTENCEYVTLYLKNRDNLYFREIYIAYAMIMQPHHSAYTTEPTSKWCKINMTKMSITCIIHGNIRTH